MLEKIIALLAPHRCYVCGAEGSLLCDWCRPDAIYSVPDRCYRCLAVSQDAATCPKCRKQTSLNHVWVRGVYAEVTRDLVYGLKFERTKTAAQLIAQLLDEDIPDLPKDTIVTYVPTATSRVRLRGYDQARLIAQAFSKQRGLQVQNLLVRHGQTRQVRSDKKTRVDQASKAYSFRTNQSLKGKTIVVIDDIMTTGATLEAVAKILKKAGATQVNAAVFAQKQ